MRSAKGSVKKDERTTFNKAQSGIHMNIKRSFLYFAIGSIAMVLLHLVSGHMHEVIWDGIRSEALKVEISRMSKNGGTWKVVKEERTDKLIDDYKVIIDGQLYSIILYGSMLGWGFYSMPESQ